MAASKAILWDVALWLVFALMVITTYVTVAISDKFNHNVSKESGMFTYKIGIPI